MHAQATKKTRYTCLKQSGIVQLARITAQIERSILRLCDKCTAVVATIIALQKPLGKVAHVCTGNHRLARITHDLIG